MPTDGSVAKPGGNRRRRGGSPRGRRGSRTSRVGIGAVDDTVSARTPIAKLPLAGDTKPVDSHPAASKPWRWIRRWSGRARVGDGSSITVAPVRHIAGTAAIVRRMSSSENVCRDAAQQQQSAGRRCLKRRGRRRPATSTRIVALRRPSQPVASAASRGSARRASREVGHARMVGGAEREVAAVARAQRDDGMARVRPRRAALRIRDRPLSGAARAGSTGSS